MASELDYKAKFAEYLFEGCAPLEAAMRTFKPEGYTNAGFLMKITREWPNDPDVIKFKEELDANTTSETKFSSYVMNQAKKAAGTREEPQLLRLFAEVRGFLKSSGVGKKGEGSEGADKLQELRDMFL